MGSFNKVFWRLAWRRVVVPMDTRHIITMGKRYASEWVRIGKTRLFWRRSRIWHFGEYWAHPTVQETKQRHREAAEAAKEQP